MSRPCDLGDMGFEGGTAITWALLLGSALLLVECCSAVERTFAYVPYLGVGELLLLGVDDLVFYEPPNSTLEEWNETAKLFDELRLECGRGVYVVVGSQLDETSDFEEMLERVRGLVDYFRGHVDGFILWDDPLAKGGSVLRNAIARNLQTNYTEVAFGISLDLNSLSRDDLTRFSMGNTTPLGGLDLSFYQFVVSYYYGWIDSTGWDMKKVVERQGSYDSGNTHRLRKAISGTMRIGREYDLEIWFLHNAHSVRPWTTTVNQMLADAMVSMAATVDRIGWFTFDGSGYFGDFERSAPDGWIRYYFLVDSLVDLAKRDPIANITRQLGNHEVKLGSLNQLLLNATRMMGDLTTNISNISVRFNATATDLEGLATDMTLLETDLLSLLEQIMGRMDEGIQTMYTKLEELDRTASDKHSELGQRLEQLNTAIGRVASGLNNSRTETVEQIQSLHQLVQDLASLTAKEFQRLSKYLASNQSGFRQDLADHVDMIQNQIRIQGDILLGKIESNEDDINLSMEAMNLKLEIHEESLDALKASTQSQGEHLLTEIEGTRIQDTENHNQLKNLIYIAITLSGTAIGLCIISLLQQRS